MDFGICIWCVRDGVVAVVEEKDDGTVLEPELFGRCGRDHDRVSYLTL